LNQFPVQIKTRLSIPLRLWSEVGHLFLAGNDLATLDLVADLERQITLLLHMRVHLIDGCAVHLSVTLLIWFVLHSCLNLSCSNSLRKKIKGTSWKSIETQAESDE